MDESETDRGDRPGADPAERIGRWAEAIWRAREQRRSLDAAETLGPLSMEGAYRVQNALTSRRLSGGERIVGWKLGYTSEVMRRQMGVTEPNFGPLTDAMLLPDGAAVSDVLVQPRVEPEIALRFARALSAVPGPVGRDDVLAAADGAFACLEVVHSTWIGYRFTIAQNTADGSSAAQVVLGPALRTDALDAVGVQLSVDGEPAGRGRGSDASGHPADGVVWLLDQLAQDGRGLRSGDIVITGGLTAAAPLQPGCTISARFDGPLRDGPVVVSVRRRGQPVPSPDGDPDDDR